MARFSLFLKDGRRLAPIRRKGGLECSDLPVSDAVAQALVRISIASWASRRIAWPVALMATVFPRLLCRSLRSSSMPDGNLSRLSADAKIAGNVGRTRDAHHDIRYHHGLGARNAGYPLCCR